MNILDGYSLGTRNLPDDKAKGIRYLDYSLEILMKHCSLEEINELIEDALTKASVKDLLETK